jgi:uncharacterized membrane protein YeaQ/YmgE (transglycosylase-associated protein family)
MTGIGVLVWLAVGAAIGLLAASAVALATGRRGWQELAWAFAAALLGSFAWSEWFGDFSRWGGEVGGLQMAPAVLGAAIVAGLYALGLVLEGRGETTTR